MEMCDRYQTGALTPIVRWLSQGMQRAAAPPHPPRPAARAENVPAPRQEADNATPAGMIWTNTMIYSFLYEKVMNLSFRILDHLLTLTPLLIIFWQKVNRKLRMGTNLLMMQTGHLRMKMWQNQAEAMVGTNGGAL